MCVYGVRHLRTEWCTFRAEVFVRVLAQCSACAVRATHLLCAARAVHSLYVSGVERAPRTCMCTVFDMGRLSDASVVRECACVGVHPVRERAHCTFICTMFGMNSPNGAPIVLGCVLGRADCACTCTLFDMGTLKGASSVRECLY